MTTEAIYLPADLLESFATLCYRSDLQFLRDVSKILGIPTDELRRKVLEPHKRTLVRTTTNPWWLGQQCPVMIHGACGVWHRCDAACESYGTCHQHRASHKYRYDAPMFKDIPQRRVAKLGKMSVLVDTDGKVYTMGGEELKNITINLSNGLAIDNTDYGSLDTSSVGLPATTAATKEAADGQTEEKSVEEAHVQTDNTQEQEEQEQQEQTEGQAIGSSDL